MSSSHQPSPPIWLRIVNCGRTGVPLNAEMSTRLATQPKLSDPKPLRPVCAPARFCVGPLTQEKEAPSYAENVSAVLSTSTVPPS